MTDGKAVEKELRGDPKGGIPWMVILDPDGKKVVTSDGPKGNTGYPAEPAEIAWFLEMLAKSTVRITAEDIRSVEGVLKERAEKLLRGR